MKEWIITNGIGGFASSTDFGGMNIRKYNGLLVAAMKPPYNRKLILSKLDESIEIDGKKTDLYTNETITNGKTQISEGYTYQQSFEKDIIPIYTYKVQKTIIEKSICMIHGKNAVAVIYRIVNQKAKTKFNITPIVNFRDFHADSHNAKFKYTQNVSEDLSKVQIDFGDNQKVNIGVSDGKYIEHKNDAFCNMYYRIEEERGFESCENHAVPGTFTIEVKPNEDKEIVFICATNGKYGIPLDKITTYSGSEIIKDEHDRIDEQIKASKLLDGLTKRGKNRENYIDFVKKYILATDNFIVYKASSKLHTVIAGYPWFNDWSRDTLIAFEGLFLKSNRIELAEEVLLSTIKKIKDGLIPNGYDEYTGRPLYNSADSSLLFFEAVNKYLKYTGNYDFVKNKLLSHMKSIINNYIDGINIDGNNIYVDDIDYLLVAGTPKTQNTWMDAKINDIAITPRNGKAVEMNALWYNALKVMENISSKLGRPVGKIEYAYIAKKCKKSFEKEFYSPDKKCLKDTTEDDKIRPNQIFALGLSYPVLDLDGEASKETFITVTQKLLNKYGLKTLAEGEEGYKAVYIGGPAERDSMYHQGITWPWLLGMYYNAMQNLINAENDQDNKKKLEKVKTQFKADLIDTFINEENNENTYGSICEIYDSVDPQKGRGAFAQAWSVAEVYRILLS